MSSLRQDYCGVHHRIYYRRYDGDICPQCRADEEKQQFEKIIEPLKKAALKREAQEQLRLILAKLKKATLVKETPSYKLLICPFCGRKSLFFRKLSAEYECLNRDDRPRVKCSLNSSIRIYVERSNE